MRLIISLIFYYDIIRLKVLIKVNEEIKNNYYAIIPAPIRYSKELKANEKLLYGEITALSNRNGYCFAQNKYFADLYGVSNHTISQWISNLEKMGYIKLDIIKSAKKEILERRIYINDSPYVQKNTYPYVFKSTYPMYKNVKYNNIKYNKDDLFYFTIEKNHKISNEFYEILEKLELLYSKELLGVIGISKDKIEILKDIIFVLYELYNSKFTSLLTIVSREALLNLYSISKEHSPGDLLNYYKRSIINKYTNNTT